MTKYVRWLDLSHNHLTSLPDDFCGFGYALDEFHVRHNGLQSLPDCIAALKVVSHAFHSSSFISQSRIRKRGWAVSVVRMKIMDQLSHAQLSVLFHRPIFLWKLLQVRPDPRKSTKEPLRIAEEGFSTG